MTHFTEHMRFPKVIYTDYLIPKILHRKDKLLRWIAWHLPKSLVMWCAVRVGANATQGEYATQAIPELTFVDALKRWQ
jgi:hypothetical protein